MVADALKDELLRLLKGKPFVPFNVVTVSGDQFKVVHRHSVAVGKDMMFVVPPHGASNKIRLDQVTGFKITRRGRKL
jgi:hypothetical protein